MQHHVLFIQAARHAYLLREFVFSDNDATCKYPAVADAGNKHISKCEGKYSVDDGNGGKKQTKTPRFWTQLQCLLVVQMRAGKRPLTIVNVDHIIELPPSVTVEDGSAVSMSAVLEYLSKSPEGRRHVRLYQLQCSAIPAGAEPTTAPELAD